MVKWITATAVLAAAGFCQTPTFEAASVKPSPEGPGHSGWHTRTGYLVLQNQNLRTMVATAYRLTEDRVLGGPKWIDSDRYNVEARAAGPADDPELLVMLQNMLAERFQVKLHREQKELSGYLLATVKGRLKIEPDPPDPNNPNAGSKSHGSRGRLEAQRISMDKLTEILSRQLGVPVVDKTDAKGVYTFTLEWTPEPRRPAASDSLVATEPAGPTLFDALAQQLGLKLESKKIRAEVIILDQAQKPTEN